MKVCIINEERWEKKRGIVLGESIGEGGEGNNKETNLVLCLLLLLFEASLRWERLKVRDVSKENVLKVFFIVVLF